MQSVDLAAALVIAALAPFIIRWDADASSDTLRRAARCTRCGAKGATLTHPGWGGSAVGWVALPARN